MTSHPVQLTEEAIAATLRMRADDPDGALLDDILDAARVTRQEWGWTLSWPVAPSRTLVILAVLLMLAAGGAIAVWARLLLPQPLPVEQLDIVNRVVAAMNGGDEAGLRSTFAPDGIFVLPYISSDGRRGTDTPNEIGPPELGVSLPHRPASVFSAWGGQPDIGSCEAEAVSIVRCDVTMRWQVLQVETSEVWTFEFEGTALARFEMTRVDLDPSPRTLPLAYADLLAWESWLTETHPDQAAMLLDGDNLFWHFYFRYDASEAEAIGASIREFLRDRPSEVPR
jgi:hypothetical protein